MANILKDIAGVGDLTDEVMANDFLSAAKSGIKGYALALSETVTPEVRDVLKRQLDAAINTHTSIVNYMTEKGFYQAYNPGKQFAMDIQAAEKVMKL